MITKNDAETKRHFEHVTLKNADGTALRARATGKCQTRKTRPNEFKLPVKHGLRDSFYITQETAHEWRVA